MRAVKNKRRLWLGIKSARVHTEKAKIVHFKGDTFDKHQTFELDEARNIFIQPEFDPQRKTVIYLHGYIESLLSQSIHVIVDAYLKRNDHNILVLDWSELADGNYFIDAVPNLKYLARKTADVILEWVDEGFNVDKLHLVGHSLGAQLSGLIGRQVYKKTKGTIKLPRISALDPAFPTFYPAIGASALNKKDAKLVDVIHTDAWFYGAPVRTGTIDFWPNGGRTLQPGCPRRTYKMLSDNDLCSHRRSWWFWAESVSDETKSAFPAVQSKSWDDFKKGRIDESTLTQMGIDCATDSRPGDYYMQTSGIPPFSRGMAGINYDKTANKGQGIFY